MLTAQIQQAAGAKPVLVAQRGADLFRRKGTAFAADGNHGRQCAAGQSAGAEHEIQHADGFAAPSVFQQRQRQKRVDAERLFGNEYAPIRRQRRAEERAIQRVVEVGGEHGVQRMIQRGVRRAVSGGSFMLQKAQYAGKRMLDCAETAVDGILHGGQRTEQIMCGVVRRIGLAQGRHAEGADDLRRLTGQRRQVLRKAPVRLREPDIQPRRIERKACRRKRRGEKRARILKQQRTEGKRTLARKQRTRPLTEQLDIPAHAGIEVNRHGALGNLHGERGVGKLGRLFRDDQKHGNVPRAGFMKRLRGKGQKAHGFRRRGGHGNRLRRNGKKGRHRRNAHADSSSGFR